MSGIPAFSSRAVLKKHKQTRSAARAKRPAGQSQRGRASWTHAQRDDIRIVVLEVALPAELGEVAGEGLGGEIAGEARGGLSVRRHGKQLVQQRGQSKAVKCQTLLM